MNIGTCQLCGKIGYLTPMDNCVRCTNQSELEYEYLRKEAEDKELQNRISREIEEEEL